MEREKMSFRNRGVASPMSSSQQSIYSPLIKRDFNDEKACQIRKNSNILEQCMFIFFSILVSYRKKSSTKEHSNYQTVELTSYASNVMLKILQARLQQYLNQELQNMQVGFRKGKGTRNQIANIHWIIEKAKESRKILLLLH